MSIIEDWDNWNKMGICCDECNTFIKKGKKAYGRKHCFSEIFCSKDCLISYVAENIEIREFILGDDEK
jgi:hypothetical protein